MNGDSSRAAASRVRFIPTSIGMGQVESRITAMSNGTPSSAPTNACPLRFCNGDCPQCIGGRSNPAPRSSHPLIARSSDFGEITWRRSGGSQAPTDVATRPPSTSRPASRRVERMDLSAPLIARQPRTPLAAPATHGRSIPMSSTEDYADTPRPRTRPRNICVNLASGLGRLDRESRRSIWRGKRTGSPSSQRSRA